MQRRLFFFAGTVSWHNISHSAGSGHSKKSHVALCTAIGVQLIFKTGHGNHIYRTLTFCKTLQVLKVKLFEFDTNFSWIEVRNVRKVCNELYIFFTEMYYILYCATFQSNCMVVQPLMCKIGLNLCSIYRRPLSKVVVMPPYCLLLRYLSNIHWQILKKLWTTKKNWPLHVAFTLSLSPLSSSTGCVGNHLTLLLTEASLSRRLKLRLPLLPPAPEKEARLTELRLPERGSPPPPPSPPGLQLTDKHTETPGAFSAIYCTVLLSLCKIFRSVRPLRKSNSALGKSNLFRFYSSVKLLSDRKTESNKTFNSSLFGNILKKKKTI